MTVSNPHSGFPPENVPFILKYIWVLFIATGLFNARITWGRVRDLFDKNPGSELGYRRLFIASVLVTNLPWLFMGTGLLWAGPNSLFPYLAPCHTTPAAPPSS